MPEAPAKTALLMGGGGARAAYQVGVLKALAEIIPEPANNPFPIICGTSAGSINTVALASNACEFHRGVEKIVNVWSQFKLHHVFKANNYSLMKRIAAWAWANIGFGQWQNGPPSLLDNSPLRELLGNYISYEKIDNCMEQGDLYAYCLTACSYTTGESTTFFDGHSDIEEWQRTHRSGRREKMSLDHLMASSAIPVIFPSMRIGDENFGDGSMRQISPISPAVHLGADRIFIIGLRSEKANDMHEKAKGRPSLGQIGGYILDTLFLNSLCSDIERLERINRSMVNGSNDEGTGEELKSIDYMIVSPSQDIADIALKHYKKLPKGFRTALRFMGMSQGNSRRFISYLMFIEEFCQELIELGYQDTMKQQDEVHSFLDLTPC